VQNSLPVCSTNDSDTALFTEVGQEILAWIDWKIDKEALTADA
jgi:hypothetical protein